MVDHILLMNILSIIIRTANVGPKIMIFLLILLAYKFLHWIFSFSELQICNFLQLLEEKNRQQYEIPYKSLKEIFPLPNRPPTLPCKLLKKSNQYLINHIFVPKNYLYQMFAKTTNPQLIIVLNLISNQFLRRDCDKRI